MLLCRRHLQTFLLVGSIAAALCGSDASAGKYDEWLEEEVPYVIAGDEREEFSALEFDAQRDAFITRFQPLAIPGNAGNYPFRCRDFGNSGTI